MNFAAKIGHALILSVVAIALVGVNVSSLYCLQCEETYLQVVVVPQETHTPCGHACNCCNEEHRTPCLPQDSGHSFYKVAESFQIEETITPACNCCLLGVQEFVLSELPCRLVCGDFSYKDGFPPGAPFAQERLCTYRC